MLELEQQIAETLRDDPRFQFKQAGKYLQRGICPSCNKKELFVAIDKPYVLKCNRLNNCTYEGNVRDLLPQLFENFSKRCPATKENPKATADAYMAQNRQFPVTQIGDWYEQESYRFPNSNEYADTVRFYFDAGRTRYWERLIDKAKADGQRHNIGGKRKHLSPNSADYETYNRTLYKGEWWQPPGQVINSGDTVVWTEGIFHAIAFYLSGHKAIAAIAANNFPELALRDYLGKSITWRLALDDDSAGRSYMRKHDKKLAGEKVEFLLTGESKLDWDDLYRLSRLTDKFIDDCLYRGRLFASESISEKAYHYYCRTKARTTVLEFGNRLYSVVVGDQLEKDLSESLGDSEAGNANEDVLATDAGREIFNRNLNSYAISNCIPTFLYCEVNKYSGELQYFFNISFANDSPASRAALTGSAIESPAAFNKALLNNAAGATFDGHQSQFKIIRDRWFGPGILQVETVPFVGYDRESGIYVFPDFAFHRGKQLKMNLHGYFESGRTRLKTNAKAVGITYSDKFDPAWIQDFYKVFHHNGMVCLAFWLGSLFAEQIRAELKVFPFLEMTGEHGVGKSTLLEFLWRLVGRDDYEGFDPGKATFAARARAFSQVANLPIALIESDHDEDKSKKGRFSFEELKTAYNGRAIRSIGAFNRGNDTEEPPFRGAIVIAQNNQVDGSPALLSRIVHCHFTSAHFTPESKKLSRQFETMALESVAGFLTAVLGKESEVLRTILDEYPILDEEFTASEKIRDQRIVKTHAMVAAMVSALRHIFPVLTQDVIANLQKFILCRAVERQSRMIADHPIVQQFWEQYELLNLKKVAQDELPAANHNETIYEETLNHSRNPSKIAINLAHFYQECAKARIETIPSSDLKGLLAGSRRYKFLTQTKVNSKLFDKSIHCWVFEASQKT